jgi:hypothetical protein
MDNVGLARLIPAAVQVKLLRHVQGGRHIVVKELRLDEASADVHQVSE